MMRDLMALTLRNPRGGMRAVLNLGLDTRTRWLALVLVAVVTTLLSVLVMQLLGAPIPEASMGGAPLPTTAVQAAVLVLGAGLIFLLGRAAGGQGRFGDALLVVTWLQVFLVALQMVQILLVLVVPPLGGVVLLIAMAAFFWLLTHFVAEMHGFTNLFLVFGAILGSLMLLGILLAPVLAPMMGIEVPGV